MTIFDSSGIEAFVTENNPKYANRTIKQLKAYAKAKGFDENYDPYKAAYGPMPSHASANSGIKQLFINGHFCYAYKFGIVTNGLGIIRHIAFYDKYFFNSHPVINPKTFLGDAAFDSVALYKELLSGDTFGKDRHFSKAYIPLNSRSGLENPDYTINADGIPCCPHNEELTMKYQGTSKLKSGVTRYKFICPMIKWEKNPDTGKYVRVCRCDNPCTTSSCGRMVYLYPEKDLRAYPGTLRGTEE